VLYIVHFTAFCLGAVFIRTQCSSSTSATTPKFGWDHTETSNGMQLVAWKIRRFNLQIFHRMSEAIYNKAIAY